MMSVEVAVIIGVGFFLSLAGVVVYLWRERCSIRHYVELGSILSQLHYLSSSDGNSQHQAPPSCSSSQPVAERTESIPLVVPPKIPVRVQFHLENDKHVGADNPANSDLDPHRSSLESTGGSALGALNPDLHKLPGDISETDYPEGNIGKLWYVVQYERETEQLLLTLIKVSSETLSHRSLKVLVYEMEKHQLIGHVTIPLNNKALGENVKVAMCKNLETEDLEVSSEYGDVKLSLCHNDDLRRLTVLVLRARGLKFQEEKGLLNAYIQVSLLHRNQFRKSECTTVVSQTLHPVFNEMFHFKVDQSVLDTTSLLLSVHHHRGEEGSQLLGRVLLGPFIYTHGKQLKHWSKMINKPKEFVMQWHALSKGL